MTCTRSTLCSLFVAAILFGASSQAQDYLTASGTPAFNTAFPVENGFINLANGNLHLELPVYSSPQRGSVPFRAAFVYDSRIWFPYYNGSSWSWQPTNAGSLGGWRFVTSADVGTTSYTNIITNTSCSDSHWGNVPYSYQFTFYWTDPRGTKRTFPVNTVQYIPTVCTPAPPSGTPNGSAFAQDGSGYKLYATNYSTVSKVLAPDGTQVYPSVKDRNGNYYSRDANNNVIDTLGRTPIAKSVSGSYTYYDYLSISSATSSCTATSGRECVKLTTGPISVSTAFGQSGVTEYSGTITVPTRVDFPDGTYYSFSYDSYGELASIKLPTGGTVYYGFTNFTDAQSKPQRWVSSRTVGSGSWNFYMAVTGSCAGNLSCQTTRVVPPHLNESVYSFGLNNGAWAQQYQTFVGAASAGNVIVTVQTSFDYSNSCSDPCSGSVDVLITRITTTLPPGAGGFQKKVEYAYDSPSTGNVTAVKEWNYTTGSFGSIPDRETSTTYVTTSAYTDLNILNLPSQVIVKAAGLQKALSNLYYDASAVSATSSILQHDYTNYSSSFITRGNLTKRENWLDTDNSYPSSQMTYDDLGNVLTVTDNALHTTTLAYAAVNQAAYLTKVQRPDTGTVHHIAQTAYDFNTGRVVAICGENFTGTCAFTPSPATADLKTYAYDSSLRPLHNYWPGDGSGVGQTDFAYSSYGTNLYTQTQTTIDASKSTNQKILLDDFGRVSRTFQVMDAIGTNNQRDTCYDSSGRVSFISYPYQSTGLGSTKVCSGSGDTYLYSFPAGTTFRTQVTHADSSVATTDTLGRTTVVTDEGNGTSSIKRAYYTDGFGRNIATCEVSTSNLNGDSGTVASCGMDIPLNGFVTSFSYNAFNELMGVIQANQARSYSYDSLGRLTGVTTPESGTATFSYNVDGLLNTRIRPAPNGVTGNVNTAYSYDPIHRVTSITYTEPSGTSPTTPTATYAYDLASDAGGTFTNPIGRLSRAVAGQTKSWYGYDSMGRVSNNYQMTPTQYQFTSYPMTATYDKAGDLLTFNNAHYTKTYSYDMAQRVQSLTSSWSGSFRPASLFSDPVYGPFGLTEYKVGSSIAGGVKTTISYNSLGRLAYKSAINSGGTGTTVFSIGSVSTPLTYAPNGMLTSAAVNGSTWTQTYDDLGRLKTSQNGTTVSYNFDDDRYGNRLHQTVTTGTGNTVDTPMSGSTNFIASGNGVNYDALGNIINDGLHSYKYDAENRIIQVDGGSTASYVYDAFSRRTQKTTSSGTLNFIYDLSNHITGVYNTASPYPGETAFVRDEIYLGDFHLATYTPTHTYFHHRNLLGSRATTTDENGAKVQDCEWYPYGDLKACSTNSDLFAYTPHGYADYDRDSETQLDHMRFRYYNSRLGRFMSADPDAGSARVGFPQSFNRTAYGMNNPVNFFDPLGLDCVYMNDDGDDIETVDRHSDNGECSDNGGFWTEGSLTGIIWGGDGSFILVGSSRSGEQHFDGYAQEADGLMDFFGTATCSGGGVCVNVCLTCPDEPAGSHPPSGVGGSWPAADPLEDVRTLLEAHEYGEFTLSRLVVGDGLIATGGIIAATTTTVGVGLCSTGVGCIIGGPMIVGGMTVGAGFVSEGAYYLDTGSIYDPRDLFGRR